MYFIEQQIFFLKKELSNRIGYVACEARQNVLHDNAGRVLNCLILQNYLNGYVYSYALFFSCTYLPLSSPMNGIKANRMVKKT